MNESIKRLEEKIAFLERHVTEQDRAMLEMVEDVARLRRELTALRERLARTSPAPEAANQDERPPHY